jgi:hypothetical protein
MQIETEWNKTQSHRSVLYFASPNIYDQFRKLFSKALDCLKIVFKRVKKNM